MDTAVLRNLLLKELRDAMAARIDGGADPGAVTADLAQRLLRLRRLTAPGG